MPLSGAADFEIVRYRSRNKGSAASFGVRMMSRVILHFARVGQTVIKIESLMRPSCFTVLQGQQLHSGLQSVHSNVHAYAPVLESLVPVDL